MVLSKVVILMRSLHCLWSDRYMQVITITVTHTHLTALSPGLPRWASTRKVKPIWILLKQETVSGSGISWAICKSAPRSRHHASTPPLSFFTGWTPFLPPNQQHQSTEGKSPLLLQTFKIRTPSALCITLQFKGSDINTSFADWVCDANTFVGYWTPRRQVISQYWSITLQIWQRHTTYSTIVSNYLRHLHCTYAPQSRLLLTTVRVYKLYLLIIRKL